MSIFASLPAPDDSEHTDDCACWDKQELENGGEFWRISSDVECDCGQPDAPIIYQGSHVLPSLDDKRGGSVDIALIPAHIRYWRDNPDAPVETEPHEPPEPFLRFGVNGETVILTRHNVRQISHTLSDWLARTGDRHIRR